MPVKVVFENHLKKIDIFRDEKPEVYKVLKYILGSDLKVFKSQCDTIDVKLKVSNDSVFISNEAKEIFTKCKINLKMFSKASFGEFSDESRIVKAWHELADKAEVIDKHQLVQDFDDLLTEQWPCNMLGCYLSKYLEEPRY